MVLGVTLVLTSFVDVGVDVPWWPDAQNVEAEAARPRGPLLIALILKDLPAVVLAFPPVAERAWLPGGVAGLTNLPTQPAGQLPLPHRCLAPLLCLLLRCLPRWRFPFVFYHVHVPRFLPRVSPR